MAKPLKSALTDKIGNIKEIMTPIVLSPADAAHPRERIDVIPHFIDFKIAAMSEPELIDNLGMVKRAKKDLEKWEKLAVDVVKAKSDLPVAGSETTIIGDKCRAIITCTSPRRIDLEKLIAKYGESELDDCYSEKEQYTLNIKPNI